MKIQRQKSNNVTLTGDSLAFKLSSLFSFPLSLIKGTRRRTLTNIPTFPDYCKLNFLKPENLAPFTEHLLPHSDFSYSNLWSWNIGDKFKFSILNDNLVITFYDYETEEPFLYFVGKYKINETAKELILFANNNGYSRTLNLIPEDIALNLDKSLFLVEEDRDYHDYIFSVANLAELAGNKYKSKRQLAAQFSRNYPNYQFKQIILDTQAKKTTLDFLKKENLKRASSDKAYYLECESAALEDFFSMEDDGRTYVSHLYNEGELVGISIDEITEHGFSMSHFFKVDLSYKGAYDTLNSLVAQKLKTSGCLYWNWAEDVGVEKLRTAKMSYRPVKFLKKYKVSLI